MPGLLHQSFQVNNKQQIIVNAKYLQLFTNALNQFLRSMNLKTSHLVSFKHIVSYGKLALEVYKAKPFQVGMWFNGLNVVDCH